MALSHNNDYGLLFGLNGMTTILFLLLGSKFTILTILCSGHFVSVGSIQEFAHLETWFTGILFCYLWHERPFQHCDNLLVCTHHEANHNFSTRSIMH